MAESSSSGGGSKPTVKIAFSGGEKRESFRIGEHKLSQEEMVDLFEKMNLKHVEVTKKSQSDTSLILVPEGVPEASESSRRRVKGSYVTQSIREYLKDEDDWTEAKKIASRLKSKTSSSRRPKSQSSTPKVREGSVSRERKRREKEKVESQKKDKKKSSSSKKESAQKDKDTHPTRKGGKRQGYKKKKKAKDKDDDDDSDSGGFNLAEALSSSTNPTSANPFKRLDEHGKEMEIPPCSLKHPPLLKAESGYLWVGDPMNFIRGSSPVANWYHQSWTNFNKAMETRDPASVQPESINHHLLLLKDQAGAVIRVDDMKKPVSIEPVVGSSGNLKEIRIIF